MENVFFKEFDGNKGDFLIYYYEITEEKYFLCSVDKFIKQSKTISSKNYKKEEIYHHEYKPMYCPETDKKINFKAPLEVDLKAKKYFIGSSVLNKLK